MKSSLTSERGPVGQANAPSCVLGPNPLHMQNLDKFQTRLPLTGKETLRKTGAVVANHFDASLVFPSWDFTW